MDTPLITFALISFNQEKMIAEAVNGAFSQTYSRLEIILSDDCSDDRTFEIILDMVGSYKGPHKVHISRNETNLGLVGHFNKVVSMATGELVVGAAGDDVLVPQRCERPHSLWRETGNRADRLCFGYVAVTPEGEQVRAVPKSLTIDEICRRGSIHLRGARDAWSRRLFQKWGAFAFGESG